MSNDLYNDFLKRALQEEPTPEVSKDEGMAEVTFRVDADCQVHCDGDFLLLVNANQYTNEKVSSGQHLLQFFSTEYDDLDPLERFTDYDSGKKYFENVMGIKQLIEERKVALEAEAAERKAAEHAQSLAEITRKESTARRMTEEKERRRKFGEDVTDYPYTSDTLKLIGGEEDVIYTGHIRDDRPDGKGKAVWADGSVYEGEWNNGNPFGHGKMVWSNGSVYEGEWDGCREGYGKMVWPDNRMYEGEWFSDKFGYCFLNNTHHGKYTNNDHVLEGEWIHIDVYKNDDDLDKSMLVGPIDVEGNQYYLKYLFTTKLGGKGTYVGPLKDGKPEGKGKVVFDSGSVYEGDFHNGWRDGEGVHTFANGDRYEGSFKEDMRTGQAEYIFKNGDVYEGVFLDGKLTGNGKVKYADGSVYEGDLKDMIREGRGKCTWVDGRVFEGEWKEDKFTSGELTWPSGASYTGSIKDNVFNGFGIYKGINGRSYQGSWEYGSNNANIQLTYPEAGKDGVLYYFEPLIVYTDERMGFYSGQHKDWIPEGRGRLVFTNGDIYWGDFHNGFFCGQGILKKKNGESYNGEFKDGEMNGHGVYKYASGDSFEGEFKDGKKLNKPNIYRWAKGRDILECEGWVNGSHGKAIRKRPDGSKEYELWEHGKFVRKLSIFERVFK